MLFRTFLFITLKNVILDEEKGEFRTLRYLTAD